MDIPARLGDRLVEAGVLILASWTVSYHVGLLVELDRDLVVLLAVVVTGAAIAGLGRLGPPAHDSKLPAGGLTAERGWLVASIGFGVAAVLLAIRLPSAHVWWGVWALSAASLASAAGALLLGTTSGRTDSKAPSRPQWKEPASWGWIILVAAVAFALASLLSVRPDADDVWYVGQAWDVAEGDGSMPVDVHLFEPPASDNFSPPTAWEPLLGSLARVFGMAPPTVFYLLAAPVVSALGILALWRLVREMGTPFPVLATAAASAFLVLDGAVHRSFGNFHFARAWQGKTVLLMLVIPVIWVAAARWSRCGDRRALALLVAGSVAATGLSGGTALLIVYPLVLVVLLSFRPRDQGRRVVLGLLAVSYVLVVAFGTGVTMMSDEGTVTTETARTEDLEALGLSQDDRIDRGPSESFVLVIGSGWLIWPVAAAVLLGWLAAPDRRVAWAFVGAAALALTVSQGPLVSAALEAAPGASSMWRTWWIVPLPLIVGLLVVAPLSRGPGSARLVTFALLLAALGTLVVLGTPVVGRDNGATLGRPAWDVDPQSHAAADRLTELGDGGMVAAAPGRVSEAVSITTRDVDVAIPRKKYVGPETSMIYERLLVTTALDGSIPEELLGRFPEAIETLGVTAVCLPPGSHRQTVEEELRRAGFRQYESDHGCVFWAQ